MRNSLLPAHLNGGRGWYGLFMLFLCRECHILETHLFVALPSLGVVETHGEALQKGVVAGDMVKLAGVVLGGQILGYLAQGVALGVLFLFLHD